VTLLLDILLVAWVLIPIKKAKATGTPMTKSRRKRKCRKSGINILGLVIILIIIGLFTKL
jgi:hypothetical protein